MNIGPTILRKKMEDDLDVRAFGDSGEGESLIEVGDQSRRKVVPAGVDRRAADHDGLLADEEPLKEVND